MQTWKRLTDAVRDAAARESVRPPHLDRAVACALFGQVSDAVGLCPALDGSQINALLAGFLCGDQTPFEALAEGREIAADLAEEGVGMAEILAVACLLAARDQWRHSPRIVYEDDRELSTPGVDACPTCGTLSRLEVLAGEDGRRYLACPACETLWRINRVGCPRCGESDGAKLAVISHPDEGGRFVIHCQSCNRAWRRLNTGKQDYPDGLTLTESLFPWKVEEALADLDFLPIPLRPAQRELQTTTTSRSEA